MGIDRSNLEAKAREILGSAFRADASDDAIRRAVIRKLCPQAKLAGKSSEYLVHRFDIAVAAAEGRLDALDAGDEGARTDAASRRDAMLRRSQAAWKQPPTGKHGGPEQPDVPAEGRIDSNQAREAMLERQRNAWKQPLTSSRRGGQN